MTQLQYLIIRPEDNLVLGATWRPDPDMGPVIPEGGSPIEGTTLVLYSEEFTRAGHGDTEEARWVDGTVVWSDTRSLADTVAAAAVAIDAAADAARLAVSPAGRDLEYQRAEAQAQAYKDAAYTGDVPPCVDSWARAKHWPAEDAANDILSTAARWYAALDGIRDLRLNAKEDARRATSSADVDTIVAQFSNDLSNLMKGLQ